MKTTAVLLLVFILGACAAKQEVKAPAVTEAPAPVSTPSATAPAPSEKPAPVVITPPKAKKEPMRVAATGYGASPESALENARLEAVRGATESLIFEGELFVNYPDRLNSLLSRDYNKFIESHRVISRKTEGALHRAEILAFIDPAPLKDRVFALNGAYLYLTPPKSAGAGFSLGELERERLLKEFAALFPRMDSLIKARITGLNYVENRVENGKVPVKVSFDLYIDTVKYNDYAAKFIDIILRKMGGRLAYEAPAAESGEDFPGFVLPDKAPLDDHLAALVVNDILKVYYIGNDYLDFYRKAYREGKLTGDPYKAELTLKLKGTDGAVLYEDYITPFNYQRDYSYGPEPVPTYPSVYIVNKNPISAYNGRFLNNSPSHNAEGVVNSWAEYGLITNNPMRELNTFEKNFMKKALFTPYIIVRISKKRAAVKTVNFEYEGLIDLSLVKQIRSVELEYK